MKKRFAFPLTLILLAVVIGVVSFNTKGVLKSPEVNSFSGSLGEDSVRYIEISAKRFEYNPREIKVRLGETVSIKVISLDSHHGIRIDAFDVRGKDSITFVADKVGTFSFVPDIYSGEGDRDMVGTLIVSE